MAWRFRCNMHFTDGSGMAAWAKAQNDVRLGQAYHLNADALNAELSQHEVDGDTYTANFFFPDEALALDTFATMTEESVTAWLKPDAEHEQSFVDVHECRHDLDPPQPCSQPSTRWPTA